MIPIKALGPRIKEDQFLDYGWMVLMSLSFVRNIPVLPVLPTERRRFQDGG
jgi:NADH:ubiquinone oxidoreductase subunit H